MKKYIATILFTFVFLAVSQVEAYSINPPTYSRYCTMEYSPVCGQKVVCPTCNIYRGIPCVGCYFTQKTYSNVCFLNQDGAQFLNYGVCEGNTNINKVPVISSFSGPTKLNVDQTGTWKISASDPENGQLTYYIDWGDKPTYIYSATKSANYMAFTQSTTFQHSYAQAGTYTVSIIVKDNAGKTTESTTTVRVDEVHYTPQPWPYYYDYNNYYDNYYYDWNWQWQNPYSWGGWDMWNNNQGNYWVW